MRQCEKCGKREFARERKLKRCSRCKIVLYCSEKCQRADWSRHKNYCKPSENLELIPECGLCGNRRGPLEYTECCNRLVCDDEGSYRMHSYSRMHCSRNHRRYTICGYHCGENHKGKWQDCQKCKDYFRECDGSLGYEYASKAGNPPHLPFKFNFDKDAMEFNWKEMEFPECDMCQRPVDTVMESFMRLPGSCGLLQCAECAETGQFLCTCTPKMHVINSMDRS